MPAAAVGNRGRSVPAPIPGARSSVTASFGGNPDACSVEKKIPAGVGGDFAMG
ncbi:MAG: hypothetical protein K6A95_05355 [Bacteroidales bacterium]|nr:hypothetical protein [Bacteroidales bacterium]